MGSCTSGTANGSASAGAAASQHSSETHLQQAYQGLKAMRLPSKPRLERLISIDASHNSITLLPLELEGASKLETLDVSHNPLADVPNELVSLTNLVTLNVERCDLKEFPDALLYLPRLRSVNLSGNPSLTLPTAFKTLVNLTHVSLLDMGFFFWPSQLNVLPNLIVLRVGGRVEHPIRLNRVFPKLPPSLKELHLAFVDYRGMCCARDHKLAQPPYDVVQTAVNPIGNGHHMSPHHHHAQSSSGADPHTSNGHHHHGGGAAHTEISHVTASTIVSAGGVAIATPATPAIPSGSGGSSTEARIWQHAPGETTRRRHSVGVGRMTGGGLSTLLPNSLVHIMVNRRPPDGNVHAHKTRDLPFNLLSLNGLQIIALRNMNLRAFGGIHHITSLLELDVENNALDSLPVELASCHSLRLIKLKGNPLLRNWFMERGFPPAHENKLIGLGNIPAGVPGCTSIEELKVYLTREVAGREDSEDLSSGEVSDGDQTEDGPIDDDYDEQAVMAANAAALAMHQQQQQQLHYQQHDLHGHGTNNNSSSGVDINGNEDGVVDGYGSGTLHVHGASSAAPLAVDAAAATINDPSANAANNLHSPNVIMHHQGKSTSNIRHHSSNSISLTGKPPRGERTAAGTSSHGMMNGNGGSSSNLNGHSHNHSHGADATSVPDAVMMPTSTSPGGTIRPAHHHHHHPTNGIVSSASSPPLSSTTAPASTSSPLSLPGSVTSGTTTTTSSATVSSSLHVGVTNGTTGNGVHPIRGLSSSPSSSSVSTIATAGAVSPQGVGVDVAVSPSVR